ncbi:hypothetical protein C2G38_2269055 [Gigaspora rosea]|uniref:Uncharacterized protein n=1 Tax=Gigaspora rosea TaxID=44941 RepID=A0A397UFG9_9GLOM|nr:hypothetical protein C2G38_2269055 [Gigaspora rosea]
MRECKVCTQRPFNKIPPIRPIVAEAKGSNSSLDSQTLISEEDFLLTILSEIKNEKENLEETYDISETISDVYDLQEMNSDSDEWQKINNIADEQENTKVIKIEDKVHKTIHQSPILDIQTNYNIIQNRMQQKCRTKYDQIFNPGELVKVRIPDIDSQKMNCQSLPCKIIQKMTNHDLYQIACQFGVLEHWYPVGELDPLETSDDPSLDVVPLNTTISLKQACFMHRFSQYSRQIDEFGENSKMNLLHIKR